MHAARNPRRITLTGALAALLGVVLFAWFVRQVGPEIIWAGLRQVGWGLVLIVAIAGLRFAARAVAWSVCLEPPHRLRLQDAFAAVLSGDALGNLTPLGPIVGEPAKAAFVRHHVPLAPALTALAIENLFYTMSVGAMIAAAMIALLFAFELPDALRDAGELAVFGILGILTLALWLLWRRPSVVGRSLAAVLPRGSALHARLDRIRALEQEVYTFAVRRRSAVLAVLSAVIAFHALGVLEVYITWWLMLGAPPLLLTAFILEGATRLITVVFKFVPLRLGVEEAGLAGVTTLLGFGAAPGTTLAIVRKIRVLFWTSIGTAQLVRRGLTPRRLLDEQERETSGNGRTTRQGEGRNGEQWEKLTTGGREDQDR